MKNNYIHIIYIRLHDMALYYVYSVWFIINGKRCIIIMFVVVHSGISSGLRSMLKN